jgi:hypothetical protein
MKLNLRRVAEFIRRADNEELLDRVTIYRAGMEPAALDLMEGELDRRGISREEIAAHHEERMHTAIILPDGTALRCNFCSRPAVIRARGWYKMFRRVPIFPRFFAYCANHKKHPRQTPDSSANPTEAGGS